MTDENYSGLTQLGHHVEQPASPDTAKLERVANPSRGRNYVVRFTCPEFTALCPITGQPDFAHIVIDYHPARLDRREQVAEAVPHVVPQPWGIPRGLHNGRSPNGW